MLAGMFESGDGCVGRRGYRRGMLVVRALVCVGEDLSMVTICEEYALTR